MTKKRKEFGDFAQIEWKLLKNPQALREFYIPEHIAKRSEIFRLYKELSSFLKYGMSNNILLSGLRGSGKTVTVRYIKKELDKIRKDIRVEYVKCADMTSVNILEAINRNISSRKTTEELIQEFIGSLNGNCLIILDEVDKARRIETLLFTLSRQETKHCINFIVVSNNLNWEDSLGAPTRSSLQLKEIIFNPYKEKNLLEIIEYRIKDAFSNPEAFSKEAKELIAKKTAEEQEGDCRIVITTLFKVAEYVNEKNRDKITEKDVIKIFPKAVKEVMEKRLNSLEDNPFLILFSCVTDGEKTFDSIFENYETNNKSLNFDKAVKETMFYYYLEYLENQGFIKRRFFLRRDKKGIPRRTNKITTKIKDKDVEKEFDKRWLKLSQ